MKRKNEFDQDLAGAICTIIFGIAIIVFVIAALAA